MADRTVAIRLTAHVQGLVAGFKTATGAVQDFTAKGLDAIGRNEQHVRTLTTQVGALGLAAVAVAGMAVKSFADFDASMSGVEAATHASVSAMQELRDAALDAGQRTQYSATEAAGAVEELAKAGVSTRDILAGGLDGALDLAAAGSLDVAEAAGIASIGLKQFQLRGEDVTHVADLMAAGAGKAMGDVTDLGLALRQVGQVANSTGLSIEETTAGLAAFASAGLLGSDAGTSFKAMLQRLTPQSGEAERKMAELGISAYDASGQFVGLARFAGNLRQALKDLTPEQRNAALTTIFGADAVRAATELYNQGEAGIRQWIAAVDDQGYAAETAAIRMDNLKGDVEQLRGALETAFINAGEAGDGPLRSLTQGGTDLVNAFSDLPDAVQGGTLAIVGGGGLVSLGVAGLGKLAIGINDTRTAFKALGISAKTAGIAAGGIGAVLGVAALGLMAWAENAADARARTEEFQATLDEFGRTTDDTLKKINENLSADRGGWLDTIFGSDPGSIIDDAEKIGIAIEDLQGYILGEADAVDRVTEATYAYNAAHNSKLGTTLRWALDDQAESLSAAEKAAAQKARADEAAGVAAEELATATQYVGVATDDATRALNDWRDSVTAANQAFVDGQGAFDAVIAKNQEYAESVAAASSSAEDSWEDYYDGVSVSAADYIAELQAQVDAQLNWETNMLEITRRVNEGMTGDMRDAGNAMIDELLALGPEGAAQVQLLKDMSDTEFAQVIELWRQKGTDAVSEFVTQVEGYRQPVIELQVETSSAYSQVSSFIRDVSGRTIFVNAAGQQVGFSSGAGNTRGWATGGFTPAVSPLTPVGLVHGSEWVADADKTARYRPLFAAMDRGEDIARLFAGGWGSGAASSTSSSSLTAADLAAALDGVSMTLMTDAGPIRAIARAEAHGVATGAARDAAGRSAGGGWS